MIFRGVTVHLSVEFTKMTNTSVGIISKAAKIRTEHQSRVSTTRLGCFTSCDQMAFVLREVLQLYLCKYFYLTLLRYSKFQKKQSYDVAIATELVSAFTFPF
jgi:hypothetical protein